MKVRKAGASDAKGIAKVHVDSWRTTYANIVSQEYLNQLSYEAREEMWTRTIPNGGIYVAETNERKIVGFSSGGKKRTEDYPGFEGEIYAIYLLQDFQGMGLGSRLVRPIIEDLQKQGINSMLVFVLEDNPSRNFYEALGAQLLDSFETEIAGAKLNERIYGWKEIAGLV